MKSQFQALSFLSKYTPKSAIDSEFIDSFLVQRFQLTPKTHRFAPNFDGTPTSRLRYLSGNYFTTHMAATKMLGKINDLLRDYLASDKWPEIEQ